MIPRWKLDEAKSASDQTPQEVKYGVDIPQEPVSVKADKKVRKKLKGKSPKRSHGDG